MPVVVGAIAANPEIYSVGMRAPLSEIQAKWDHAIANPVEPRLVNDAVCHEVIHEGEALKGEGNGLDRLPIPVSTPGFDAAPTLTATNVITRDPETGVQNMGTYRAALKAPDRLVVRMATRVGGAGGYQHYLKYQKLEAADALRHRARLSALCRFHGAAEAADRRRRIDGCRRAGRRADQYRPRPHASI